MDAIIVSILPETPQAAELDNIPMSKEFLVNGAEAPSEIPSEAAAPAADGFTVVEGAGPMSWDQRLTTWMNDCATYVENQFLQYIASVSLKMEKLEYY